MLLIITITGCKEQKKPLKLNFQKDYLVYKVIDGDTYWVRDSLKNKFKVRLIGVNTPELHHPKKAKEPFAEEAKEFCVKRLLNKNIVLKFEKDSFDRYGRLLAHVYYDDTIHINAELIDSCLADIMFYKPNINYLEDFTNRISIAKSKKRLIWKK